jgi:hypothetical protein
MFLVDDIKTKIARNLTAPAMENDLAHSHGSSMVFGVDRSSVATKQATTTPSTTNKWSNTKLNDVTIYFKIYLYSC